ncbi:helix-turn-helix domain-containing protein [Streptomyces sp. MBT53]|uniref:helix-turn-helix domain-containing protein n=1 Tax=Streptomyces sp. MBT53 TaxID=1488384 RepID=UPI001A571412|nr:helix-turn-helix domain-containing protein [Streptomyces sp. MBT53]MBK6015138.1 helix-turn-helix domain-containing protein [Streptomyces sp. MBT53]
MRTGFFPVGDKVPDWNTKSRLRALRDLLGTLPDPSTPPPVQAQRPKRNKAKRLKDAQVAELVEAYGHGATTYQLADRFDIKRQTVSAILKRNGITPRWRRLTEANLDEAERLYVQGMSLARIADRMHVDDETIRLRLRKRGVQMRDPHDRS